uniref:DNA-directed RNA polymerase n=1 Tax=Drypetes lateriflora TaxID=212297 RepID=A0A7G8QD64_9ROSI|nr:RNA polymerase alpha subunit [Drypetes lateriflora]QNK04722.1 RNA polymerase alpha subunit [Drypetes lateriflora]
MFREKVTICSRLLQWECLESRADNKRLHYGRFMLSPLIKGKAETIGLVMRRILLGEIETMCITRAKFSKLPHEFSTIAGVEDSIQEILMSLKQIVLRGNLDGIHGATICFSGPGYLLSQDIILPPSVEIIDNSQYIAKITEPINLFIELIIERGCGYRRKSPKTLQDGSYPTDAVFMPVINANYNIHSYGNENDEKDNHEILIFEIWTNGSLTPKEAINEASRNLIDLIVPFLRVEEEKLQVEKFKTRLVLPLYPLYDQHRKLLRNEKVKRTERDLEFEHLYIDQSELTPRIYNCLKKANINTVLDLLYTSREDLMRIEHFRLEDFHRLQKLTFKS